MKTKRPSINERNRIAAGVRYARSMRKPTFSGTHPLLLKAMGMDIEKHLRQIIAKGVASPFYADLGCASGGTIRELKRNFPQLRAIGIDANSKWLPFWKGKGSLHHNVKFKLAHFHQIEKKIPANSVDLMSAWLGVSYALERDEVFRQIQVVLKPGASCLFQMGPPASINMPLPKNEERAFVASLRKIGFKIRKPRDNIYLITKKVR